MFTTFWFWISVFFEVSQTFRSAWSQLRCCQIWFPYSKSKWAKWRNHIRDPRPDQSASIHKTTTYIRYVRVNCMFTVPKAWFAILCSEISRHRSSGSGRLSWGFAAAGVTKVTRILPDIAAIACCKTWIQPSDLRKYTANNGHICYTAYSFPVLWGEKRDALVGSVSCHCRH